MDPHNRGPEEDAPVTVADDTTPIPHVQQPSSEPGAPGPRTAGAARTAQVVAGEYLLTVNPVDGSEVELCPRDRVPSAQRREGRQDEDEREAHRRTALPPALLLERSEESERLVQLMSQGRSVRVTGPSGSGRTALLSAAAERCTGLAPDGVIRLSGYQRTSADLLYDLYACVYHVDDARPDRPQLLKSVREIGAVVVLDDIEFGGEALAELLSAAAECAFLISSTPDVAASLPDSYIEEVVLPGLSLAACLELLEQTVGRSLTDQEKVWAEDLWFACEGLPLRFVQAGALLRHRHVQPQSAEGVSPASYVSDVSDASVSDASGALDVETTLSSRAPEPLPPLVEAAALTEALAAVVSPAAQQTLRYAVALGGDCPHPSHLPALVGDPHADDALGELVDCGLVTMTGSHHRLTAGVHAQLAESVPDTGAKARAAAEHYAWWTGHPSITAERIGAEADAVIAAMAAAKTYGQPGVAVHLAHTAAPAFAAALNWGAWERALRIGRESARLAEELGEEAYFHHELGVLALCSGNPERARTELEASIGVRGALADRQGTVVGRRALALVMDRLGGRKPPRRLVGPVSDDVPAVPGIPGVPGIRSASPQLSAGRRLPVGERISLHQPPTSSAEAEMTDTLATPLPTADASSYQGRPVAAKSRRNMAVAGAGVVLAAVVGTVVAIGATSGHSGTSSTPTDTIPSETTQPTDDTSFPAANGATPPPSASSSVSPSASPSALPSASSSPSEGPPPSVTSTLPGNPASTDPRSFVPPQRQPHKPVPTPPSSPTSNPTPSLSPSPSASPTPTPPPPSGKPPPDPNPSSQTTPNSLPNGLPSSDSTSSSPLSSSSPDH
ncbi:MAG: ATP-binding protein [Streptomycetaceae bacterium]|nr:ATP-binding protein [Streptomycetaceae bacterium]